MPDVHETAYPRLKSSFSDKELYEFYTPSADDLALASEVTKGVGPKICFLILLKTFQRLGYFVFLQDVPKPIAEHISLLFGVHLLFYLKVASNKEFFAIRQRDLIARS